MRWIKTQSFLLVAGALVLSVWVQRHALAAFFSSPDDLVHLQQAAGLRPILPSPFRFLSQVLYFRVMLSQVGTDPVPYHLLSLLTHLLNVALVFFFARSCEARQGVAALASCFFGTFPLFYPLLASAVGMNDELALAFTLIALLLLRVEGTRAIIAACVAFICAILCKESVLSLPLLAFATPVPSGHRMARRCVLLGVALVFAGMLLLVPPQGLGPYATQVGSNVFHNLMTYAAWSVNLVQPIPDLVSSFDPAAWRVGVVVYALMFVAWFIAGADRQSTRFGVAWWFVGLLPVIFLRFQTYRHYLYPALPGLALVAASLISVAVNALTRQSAGPKGTSAGVHGSTSQMAGALLLVLCAGAYAARANWLIQARVAARVPGTQLALDPVTRRQEVAQHAVASLRQYLPAAANLKVAIFSPAGTSRVFGARTGREYARQSSTANAYSLLQASLDGGGAIRLFFPNVDSVVFINGWSADYEHHEFFLAHQAGYLVGVGSGAEGQQATARWMLEHSLFPQARDHLVEVLGSYPEDGWLRLLYATALFRTGDFTLATKQLRLIVASSPDSEAGRAAAILIERTARDSATRGAR